MKEKIMALLNAGTVDMVQFKALCSQMNTADIAEAFVELDKEKNIRLFRLLPKSMAADVFACLDASEQELIVKELTDTEISDIINHLFVDDAVDFIEEMPANVVQRVLANTKPEKRAVINQLLQYPDDSAGSIMTTEYVDLYEDITVRKAFDEIRSHGVNKETIYTCYVTRHDHLLTGIISAKTLMLAKSYERIGDIMDTNLVYAQTADDQEAVAALFKKYGLLAMPVVDKERRLVGIVTVDDIVKIIEEETTEDFEKMNALTPSDEPYLKTSVFKLARNRIKWLLFLMLSATISGSIIAGFEEAIALLPALVTFIPMLMDTGGNAGCQSSTLIIRGMAVGEIRMTDTLRILWRELRIALLCGLALGAVNFARIYLMNSGNIMLTATVTLSLFVTVILAKTIGCLLPIIAKKCRVDPAIMAAPLITTIVDGGVLVVYFSVAKLLFKI
ncbi:MAG: magnesium transporter [Treponema sp.]|jgi:magnesium transporter|nr:magnesium transporter [Treponema sp.]